MKTQPELAALAANYHKALPGRIRQYLNNRGITDLLIDYHAIGWNGNRITIPVYNREGEIAFFKLARDPEDQDGPKMMASPGGYAELYEWAGLHRGNLHGRRRSLPERVGQRVSEYSRGIYLL